MIYIKGKRLTMTKATEQDASIMSKTEASPENAAYVCRWSPKFRIKKMKDPDILQFIILDENNEHVGFAIFSNMKNHLNEIELKRIIITKKGSGYGKEAIHLLQDLAFNKFCTRCMVVKTRAFNARAQHLYKITGFVPDMPDPCTCFHMTKEDYDRQRAEA